MKIHTIESWESFVASAEQWTKEGPNGPNIFRGQADEDWKLSPSLTRVLNQRGYTPQTAKLTEDRILKDFQNRYQARDEHCRTLNTTDLLSWWEVMQHHFVPTRLLDWTKSPHAALYFAVSSLPDKNGSLFIMDAGYLQWIQSTRARDPDDKPNWAAFQELNKSVHGNLYKKSMVIISSPTPTDRMSAQHSSFTISTEILESHDVTGDDITFGRCINRTDAELSLFDKFVVSSDLKKEFTERLEWEGFHRESMFPDSRIMDEGIESFLGEVKTILDGNV
ncbi:MAG: FRG domain-containing protein [Planctomycetes bacterium]|nr:FRG domain-containing protein [Planctomycetota bacterium]